MSDSDVESDFDEGPEEGPHKTRTAFEKNITVARRNAFEFEDILEQWRRIPTSVKKETCQKMHLCVFWWHILLRQQDKSNTTHWAVQMGFLDQHVTSDLSLKRLYRIEILESILRALEKGCLSTDSTKRLFFLCQKLDGQADCVEEAVHWLEQTGEPEIASKVQKLGSRRQRVLTLSFVFTEYVHYVQAMAFNRNDIIAHYASPACKCCIERSEEMKTKGNEMFQKRKYDAAVRWYTRAIKYHPENHILYGNRALCFIRSEKYQKAIGDGKRATIIQPDWAKGHYRFCDALFFLGEHKRALEANKRAQELCCSDPEGIRDLQQQKLRFLKEMEESKGVGKRKKIGVKKDSSKRMDSVPRTGAESPHSTEHLSSRTAHGTDTSTEDHKEPGNGSVCGEFPVFVVGHSVTTEGGTQTEGNSKEPKEMKSEMAAKKKSKTELCTPEKQKARSSHSAPQEKVDDGAASEKLKDQLKSAVQDAHTALSDQRCRNAEQAFSQALCLLSSTVPKELGISELDTVVLKYGHATALLETGQPEELAEAKEEFQRIQAVAGRKFQCLIFYGIGKVYLKENRFSAALQQFSDALLMVNRQIIPGKLTWPTTKVIVEETQTEHLKDLLEKYIEMCKFPPKPDAVCRHQKCQGHSKIEIYFTDPDFKGFIRMVCCQSCYVEFHISCWKKMKAALFSDKNDKDFLQETCFTPDCGGKICRIVIFGSTGLIKCEFESAVHKTPISAKSRVKQKCTSLKKLKSKEDRKFRRKQHRQAASRAMQEKNEPIPLERTERSEIDPQEKASQAWLIYGDRVLHQISENKELLKEGIQDISAFIKTLQPWVEMDRERGNSKSIHSLKEAETMEDVVDFMLERKNRVWARVFIHTLSNVLDISPKLHDWAHRLESDGLRAAETFIERYAEHLEELDLAQLLTFKPLQDILIEKFGTMPEFFSEGSTVTDYLKQAPPQEVRLFIWTLEEKRDHYPTFHHALNEYFEIMDGLCLVIKKSENENEINSPIKTKSRSRKKKQKEPKSVIVLSGARTGTLREEDDDILSEEDSLMFLRSSDPFIVPNHLRDQVAEFEGQYVSTGSHYRRILDNNPDPTKESLYDYFAQILEEHGPMEANSQLLVGELENFPPEAKLKIEEAGGLKAFLLESLRFVMNDNLIGLMKHAVSLQEVTDDLAPGISYPYLPCDLEDISTRTPSLNPSAKEFQPLSKNHIPSNSTTSVSFESPVSLDMEEVLDPLQDPCGFNFPDIAYSTGGVIPSCPDIYMYDSSRSSLHEFFAASSNEVYEDERTLMSDSPKPYLDAFHNPSKDHRSNNNETDTIDKTDSDLYNGNFGCGLVQTIGQHSEKSLSKTVAVQASAEPRDDVAVNTEPYEPFESNKGDMTKKEKDNMEFEKQIKQMMENYKEEQQKRIEDVSVLERELEEIRQSTEITNKELELFQQKLEEEVKKDQQEKKENQETLKALKTEIKEMTESHEIISKNIKEKNKEYETHLNDFLERSNQSAAEKMSLEEQIKRCRDLCADATRRSQAAEISILENRLQRGLRSLYKYVSDGEVITAKFKEMATRFPSSRLQPTAEAWQACVCDAKEKILKTESQYKEQMELVKKGTRLCTLPLVSVPAATHPPPLPVLPMAPIISDPSVVQVVYPARQHDPRQYLAPYGAALPARHQLQQGGLRAPSPVPPVQTEPSLGKPSQQPERGAQVSPPVPPLTNSTAVRPVAPPPPQAPRPGPQLHSNVFEKIIDRLSSMFPHYRRPTLTKFIQEVRTANGGCLNNLSYEEVINRVAQLILDHQENTREQMIATPTIDPTVFGAQAQLSWTPPPRSDSPAVCRSSSTPPPSQAWKNVGVQNSSKWARSKALNVEDPCIICHEEMAQDEMCVLECRHTFHRECIKSWLKEQSTCPTCREHALLPEDFPLLPGRMRRGPTPAAPSL